MSGSDNSRPKEDLRPLKNEELNSILEESGFTKEALSKMSRWEKVNKIRELAHQPD